MNTATRDLDAKAAEKRAELKGAAEDAKGAASRAAQDVRAGAESRYEHATNRAADEARDTAGAVDDAAQNLSDGNPAAPLLRKAAGGVEEIAKYLDESTLSDFTTSVQRFAQRNPVGFLAAAGLVGFAVSRFATAEKRRQSHADDDAVDRAYARMVREAEAERSLRDDRPAPSSHGAGTAVSPSPTSAAPSAPPVPPPTPMHASAHPTARSAAPASAQNKEFPK